MDAINTLGKILVGIELRDAIHIAIAPVDAGEKLMPGQHIGLDEGKAYASATHIGVVDPFLESSVARGQRFWMFLYPNTITSLRHQWIHPAFDGVQAESEQWLRYFADRNRGDYTEMLTAAVSGKEYCFGRDIEYSDFYAGSEFWHHIEVVTGKQFSRDHQENTQFRCAC